jgi:hypothetical protein
MTEVVVKKFAKIMPEWGHAQGLRVGKNGTPGLTISVLDLKVILKNKRTCVCAVFCSEFLTPWQRNVPAKIFAHLPLL